MQHQKGTELHFDKTDLHTHRTTGITHKIKLGTDESVILVPIDVF